MNNHKKFIIINMIENDLIIEILLYIITSNFKNIDNTIINNNIHL